jgi:hypothetical protein
MAFYHIAIRIVLKDLLQLKKKRGGLEVGIPGMDTCYPHVRLEFVVGDVKG